MAEFYKKPLDPEVNVNRNPDLARSLGAIGVELWFRHADDDGELNMLAHPGNTQVYLNQQTPPMDAIIVKDPRDNLSFTTFREELGDDAFVQLVDYVQPYAAIIGVPFQPREIIETYTNRKMKDLSTSDSFPEEWLNGTTEA